MREREDQRLEWITEFTEFLRTFHRMSRSECSITTTAGRRIAARG